MQERELLSTQPQLPTVAMTLWQLNVLASWMPHGFDWASLMMTWGHLGHYLGTTWG